MSIRPGHFDTSGPSFNPKADNLVSIRCEFRACVARGILRPTDITGDAIAARFCHDVIVGEFAGPQPAPAVLDALVAYIQDIDFLPNPSLVRAVN